MPDTWATVADVLTYAKATVDQDEVLSAQAVINTYAGRLPVDADRIGARDQYWLKLAVAYQAAWQLAQPDQFERQDITSTGGGQSTQGTETWLTLAPHAAQALRRVSWLGSGSLHVRASGETSDGPREVYGDDDGDPGTWRTI
ncbi:hypothetical protein DMH03_17680 [Amycolatopsis sp. WAC 01376]|uniref:hypothetical protein n=1 Tax=Amycolatopsis sp. WAC 01376 TaxID=2203195 RepID=UPI000F7B85FA|nr:hypothetical protein [Amycolatopsis sp. WAC 01376]RSM60579.1 hypothetical protein DMH03_17680 [Amycolatopsis sp. WAC 01376]